MNDVESVLALVSGAGGVALGALLTLAWVLRTRVAARDAVESRLERIEQILAAPDQAWFWSSEWQAGEAEADADLAAGRSTVHRSTEEFLAALDALPAADGPSRAQR